MAPRNGLERVAKALILLASNNPKLNLTQDLTQHVGIVPLRRVKDNRVLK